jgi:DNA mismatch repair protein MutS2
LHKDLDFKRKRLKLDTKEFELQQTANETRALEKLLKELRDQKSVQKVEEVVQKVREVKKETAQVVEKLTQELYYKPTEAELKKSPLKAGDFVKMRAGNATGTIESINKSGDAMVQVGFMRMKLKLADLQHAPQHLETNRKIGIQLDTIQLTAAFDNKIDVRGMRREEVLRMIDDFVDTAILSNAKDIRILHGKGDGVLRLAVKQKLREFKAVKDIRHPEENDGGDGVTLATIG